MFWIPFPQPAQAYNDSGLTTNSTLGNTTSGGGNCGPEQPRGAHIKPRRGNEAVVAGTNNNGNADNGSFEMIDLEARGEPTPASRLPGMGRRFAGMLVMDTGRGNAAGGYDADFWLGPSLQRLPPFARRLPPPGLELMLPYTTRLTRQQYVYMFVNHGLVSMVLGGLVNFGVECASHAISASTSTDGIAAAFLFSPPKSLLGDAFVTALAQALVTWPATMAFAHRDLARGRLPAAGLSAAPPRWALARWFLMTGHHNAARGSVLLAPFGCGAGSGPLAPLDHHHHDQRQGRSGCFGCGCDLGFAARRVGRMVGFALAQAGRALLVGLAAFAVLAGPTIGFLVAAGMPYEGDWVFLGRWDGPIFKLVYGAALGLLMSPLLALMWIVRAGWIVRTWMD